MRYVFYYILQHRQWRTRKPSIAQNTSRSDDRVSRVGGSKHEDSGTFPRITVRCWILWVQRQLF
jgi:hypothetical protein